MALLRGASVLLRPALRATQAAVLGEGAIAAPLAAASEEARRRLHSARSATLTRIVRAMLAYVGASVTVVAASDVGGDGVYAREMDRRGPHMHNARGIMRMTATVRSRVSGAINPTARPESPMHGFMYTKVPRATEVSISSSPHNPGLAAAGLPPLPPGATQFTSTEARDGVRGGALPLQTTCTHGQQEVCDTRRPRKRGRRVGVRRWVMPDDCNLASHCPGAVHRSRGMLRTGSANAISTVTVEDARDRTSSAGLRGVLPPAEQPAPGEKLDKDAQSSVEGVVNALGEALVLAQSRAREAEVALDEAQAELQQLRLQLRWRAKDEAFNDEACQTTPVLGVHFECMDTQGDVVMTDDWHGVHLAAGASGALCPNCQRMIDEAADADATAGGVGWPWHLLHIGVAVTCISAAAAAAVLWLRAPSYLAQSLLVNRCMVTAAALVV
eukprot:jgi/Chlat1/1460/Chrsp12S02005